jgi:hypothetical protein
VVEFKDYLISNLPEENYSLEEKRDIIETYSDNFIQIDSTLMTLEKFRDDRKGFKLEFASALALNFPDNDIDLSYVPKSGLWITPSYQPFGKKWAWIEFLGVLRYFWYNANFYQNYIPGKEYFRNTTDYGLKLVLKKKKISFEMEAIGRSSSTILSKTKDTNGNTITTTRSKNDSQYIATLNYRIKEDVSISYKFGKQFQPIINYKGTLISMVSLNLGFGAPKLSTLE